MSVIATDELVMLKLWKFWNEKNNFIFMNAEQYSL